MRPRPSGKPLLGRAGASLEFLAARRQAHSLAPAPAASAPPEAPAIPPNVPCPTLLCGAEKQSTSFIQCLPNARLEEVAGDGGTLFSHL